MTKRKKLVLGVVAVLALILLVVAVRGRRQGLAVEAAAVEEREIVRTVLAHGYFQAAMKEEIIARDPVIIKDLLVEAGDMVAEGQMLAVIDTAGLEAEKQAVEAELSAVSAQLAALEATLPFQEAEAESRVAAAQENLQQTKREAAAMAELYHSGAVSEQDWQRAQTAVAAQEAQAQTAAAHAAQIKSQSSQLGHYREQIQALNSHLKLLEEKLDFSQMKAPTAGQVLAVQVEIGAVAAAGAPLFSLAGSDLIVEAEVLAQDAPELALGQQVLISGEVLRGQELRGEISRIYPQAIEKLSELGVVQRRVPIEIVLDKRTGTMRPGYPAEVEIITAKTSGLAVPWEAVFSLGGQDRLFKIKNGRAALVSVEIGLEGEDYLEILSGIKAGDEVIISPPQKIKDGAKVRKKP
ncbi:MAG TPA: efflux RND transporter periplasmic adaptor subunit [bacterium]|nr:efflux RND transporter periplasmic adaptor subunit [bacterium]